MKIPYLLVIVVFVAALLRFWQINSNPPSLTWDEVAWGYNAYALGTDGKDEFGRFLPLNYLESFGDFKPPMYAYLSILPVKIFGLSEFAVRLPSAIFGTLTVLVTFFLVKRLFPQIEDKTRIHADAFALLATFFLAISPWHINLSRAAFEANVASFFVISGVWLFLEWVDKKKWYCLSLCAVSFVFSIYTFNTARVVAPLLIVVLAFTSLKILMVRKRDVVIASAIGLLLLLPTLGFLFTPQASLRFHEVNIFSDIGIINRTNQEMAYDENVWWSRILHNRRLAYGVEYLRHYFDHFNPSFLFIRGDGNPKFSTQDVGQLYLWDLPFFILGILFFIRWRIGRWWLVFLWLLLGIVPAASARETPHALRIETTLPTFQIITAFGTMVFLMWVSSLKRKRMTLIIFSLLAALFMNMFYYLHGYYLHFPREYSGEWQYGYKEAIAYARDVGKYYDRIYTTTELGRPHIYYAFYLPIDPQIYREDITVRREEPFGIVHVERVGRYYFSKDLVISGKDEGEKILFIDLPINIPQNASILRTFYLLNGNPVLVAYTLGREGGK